MKILIIHAAAGAGHRKAAEALYDYLEQGDFDNITVTKIDALDYTNALFKKAYPAVYLFLVSYLPFVWGIFFQLLNFAPLVPVIGLIRHGFNYIAGRSLIKYVLEENPDVIICEHFFSAELISYLKRKGAFGGLVVCGVTDFGVHQFWINKGTDYYFVASEITKDELKEKGVSAEKIIVSGIPIGDQFSKDLNKENLRDEAGLDKKRFTVLVVSGGFGVGPISEIVNCLDKINKDLQVIVICGHNKGLYNSLSSGTYSKVVKVFGYVHNMHEIMAMADVIISKSGGLTVSESLAMELPMIIMKPIPGQETRNAEIIERYEIAKRLLNVNHLTGHIELLLDNDQQLLAVMKENTRKLAKPQAAEVICQWIIKNTSLMN